MTLRVAAALALLAGGALLIGYLDMIGKGPLSTPASRHLRAMKDRVAAPESLSAMTFADFAALPHARPQAEVAALERRGVSLEGYAHAMSHSSDGDIYLNLTPEPHVRWAPVPDITTEITPVWRRDAPGWAFENLAVVLRPHSQGKASWPGGPRRVRVSGWLLYDFQYDGVYSPPRTRRQAMATKRITGWEIHPVTRIEVWDDSLDRFTEVPR